MTNKLNYSQLTRIVGLFVFLLMFTTACSQPISPEGDESRDTGQELEIQDPNTNTKRVLKVASVHFPPFEVIEDGVYSGPGYDIIHEAFNRMGYTKQDYELVEFPWARTLEMIKDGDVDIIIDISQNEERKAYINFSKEPFTQYDKNFITLEDSGINYDGSIESIKDYKIGVVREYRIGPNYQEARASGTYNFEDASSFDENIKKLITGRVPIILDTTFSVQQHIKNIGSSAKLKVLEPAYDSTTTYVGFSKKLEVEGIIEAYDQAILSMKNDGTFQSILDKYFK